MFNCNIIIEEWILASRNYIQSTRQEFETITNLDNCSVTIDSVQYVHINNLIVLPNLHSKVIRFLPKVPQAMKRSMWCAIDRQDCRFMEFNHALICYLHVIIEDDVVNITFEKLDQPLLPDKNV